MKRIYLDYAATTPVDPAVLKAMEPYFTEKYGNPGSLHSFGQEAIAAIDEARATLGKMIDADFGEIIFTGSATEANNLALRGFVKSPRPKIILSAIEHESVLETARDLEKEGVETFYLPVEKDGLVDLEKLKIALDERTVLVSIMYANNEIGTIEPIAKISKIIKDFNHEIIFHTDAVQAFQYLQCDVNKLGVDLMTLSAHKIYGPKGVGVLYVRGGVKDKISPVVAGGGQEFGLRSGTENVPSIVGFAKAAELAFAKRDEEIRRVRGLCNELWEGLKGIFPGAERNGGEVSLPNILNVYFPGRLAEDLLVRLDMAGLALSSGSACGVRSATPSHVLLSMGMPLERVRSSVRFSLGRLTTEGEVREVLNRLESALR